MIRNIVYDVGYVLISYTWRNDFRIFGYDDAGVKRLSDQLFSSKDPESIRTYWEKYDMNEITDAQIEEYCYSHFPEDRKALEWFFRDPTVWCSYMTDIAGTIAAMKKKGYRTYLLSNYPKRLWDLHVGKAPFLDFLDGMVVSCDEGFGKPEERFYRVLLDRYDLKAEECLFLDDRKDNTDAADRLGFHTITLDSAGQREKAVRFLESLPPVAD